MKKTNSVFKVSLFAISAFILIACNDVDEDLVLWYDTPATSFEEALPVGNGRLGAMIFGVAINESINLNESTVWAGEPGNNVIPGLREALPEIRELIFQGERKAAEKRINDFTPGWPTKAGNSGMPYQPVGLLDIASKVTGEVSDYRRELNISSAVSAVNYSQGGVKYKRRYIASLVDDVIAVEISANKSAAIDLDIKFRSQQPNSKSYIDKKAVYLVGTSTDHENKKGRVEFAAIAKPKVEGGSVEYTHSQIEVRDADKVVIYLSIASNFVDYKDISADEMARAEDYMAQAYPMEFDNMLQRHTAKFRSYFNRVKIDLSQGIAASTLPTDKRLTQLDASNDPQFLNIFFQYGRYMMISSSRVGGQPANLQGIWSEDLVASWDSKYTININLPMNYWLCDPTNLSDMNEPLFDALNDLAITGQESAKGMYGVGGWCVHHNSDIWRISGIVDDAYHGAWPSGGGWLCQHIWTHYLYTGDKEFLRQYYPVIRGAAQFYKEALVEDPESGWLLISPSNSPENHCEEESSIVAGASMDNQIMNELFQYVIEASKILDTDHKFAQSLQQTLTRLVPMQIGRWGQLQEWKEDVDREDDKHRHISHLYALLPSNQISPLRTPELSAAAKTSLKARGDTVAGWARAWRLAAAARLLDGEFAYEALEAGLKSALDENGEHLDGGIFPNLVNCAHMQLQLDGTFGTTAGMTEMFLQSYDGALHLLPAIPELWQKGHVKGLKAIGGFEVDMEWADGEFSRGLIRSTLGGVCRVRSWVPLEGKGLTLAEGENLNPLFSTPEILKPIIHNKEMVKTESLDKIYEYDIATEIGDQIRITRSKGV